MVTREVLPFAQSGSPNRSEDRTFKVVFRFRHAAARPRTATRKPRKTYCNPIFLALEWQQALERGEASSRAELARRQGVSRARVTQVLGLLTLPPKIVRKIRALGDPLESPAITERQLRPLIQYKVEEQERSFDRMLAESQPGRSS